MGNIILALTSILFLSLPWYGFPGYSLLVAFVPLLMIRERLEAASVRTGRKSRFLWYVLAVLIIWNTVCVWWVAYAVWFGPVAGVLANTFIAFIPWVVFHYVRKRAPKALAYTILAAGSIAYEYIYINGEITFPWMLLGNGFANTVKAVQWYEYTGIFGGTLWVWIVNLFTYEAVVRYRKKSSWKNFLAPGICVLLPVLLSLCMYTAYREEPDPVTVEVIQPNFDPYEKFGTTSQREQTRIILELSENAPPDVDFIVAPETAIDDRIWEHELDRNPTVDRFRDFMSTRYPEASYVIGAVTNRRYDREEDATFTARTFNTIDFWFDVNNAALNIDSSRITAVHQKVQLVIGAEMMPYQKQLRFLSRWKIDLGGFAGQYGRGEEATVFTSPRGRRAGVAICYESIFGEYFTEYTRNGAEVALIITNDGWWKDTPGYKQHFSFARLRAIENRRSIGRSANTGISGFIDQRGDVVSRTGWDERVTRTGVVNGNRKLTFYVRYGDLIGRIALYTVLLCLLYYLAYRRKVKDYLIDQSE